MPNYAKLDTTAHRDLRINGAPSAALGDAQRFASVVPAEFTHAAATCPLFFSKDSETGTFYSGAMMGFDEGENLFLGEAGYQGHRPLSLQRMPFYTAGTDLVIDLDHPRVGAEGASALFDDEGKPSPYLESVIQAMRELHAGQEQAKLFIEMLLSHDLIEAVDVDIAFEDGAHHHIQGLYSVNRERLQEQPDAVVVELFRRGYMLLIHTMMVSQRQLPALIERRKARKLQASAGLQF
jgi:hypothetical protein